MGSGRLWVGVAADSGSHRGGTLVIVTPESLTSTDPGPSRRSTRRSTTSPSTRSSSGWPTTRSSPSSRPPAPAGCGSSPTLRSRSPTPADGGTTYAFRLRPGIRYSDGQPLRASDFRRGIERLFRVGSPGTSYYSGLVGAAALCPAAGQLRPLPWHRHRRRRRYRHLPPHRTRSSVPVQPDRVWFLRTHPGRNPRPRIWLALRSWHRTVQDRRDQRHRDPVRPQSALSRVVTRRPASRQSRRDRVAIRADHPGRRRRCRARTSRLALRADPTGPIPAAPAAESSSAAFNPGVHRRLRAAQHAPCPVQQRSRQAGTQLRDQPAQDRPALRRARLRHPNLPADRARPARLPAATAPTRCTPARTAPGAPRTWHAPGAGRANRERSASGSTSGAATTTPTSPRAVPAYIAGVLRALGYRVRLHLVPFATITPGDARAVPAVSGRRLGRQATPTRRPTSLILRLQRRQQQRLLLQPATRPRDATSRATRTQ